MYDEQEHIQTAQEGHEFGHRGDWRYRVMNRDKTGPVHHTNSMADAKGYFRKCRDYWLKQDALSVAQQVRMRTLA